jgi:hypothetical protein
MTLSARNWAWDVTSRQYYDDGVGRDVSVDLKPGEKLTLLCLPEHENAEEGFAYPSYETIAGRTGLSVRSVQTHVKALERYGAIVIGKKNRSRGGTWLRNTYELNVPAAYRDSDPKWRAHQPG